jgi:acetate kinase
MNSVTSGILAINAGSSSIRFALYEQSCAAPPVLRGKLDRIGLKGTKFTSNVLKEALMLDTADRSVATSYLLEWLEEERVFDGLSGIGHRIVHGMHHAEPVRVTNELLAELSRISPYDPEHLPQEIALMEQFQQRHPQLVQVACFDTAFHHEMPRVAKLLPIPRRYEAKGVQRYGFHGLSYSYLMEELQRLGDPAATSGRVILAHLGSGASMCAVKDGQSIDTSMGFTPTGGLVMGTRSGDLDPGIAPYLARTQEMTTIQFYDMANHESGLLGLSETSSDMRDLVQSQAADHRAAEAVALFCYQAKKYIGSYAAVLGGVETLVFAGGIGENCPVVRSLICDGLGFLGVELDALRNAECAPVISPPEGRVNVRVIQTDEELMIARLVRRVLDPVAK